MAQEMTPEQIEGQGRFPCGPLLFPDHAEGGCLTRFDLPEHVLPEKLPRSS
jgi:hypothetical protein